MKISTYKRYRSFKPFTDDEAWTLYKVAAVGEAIGWMMLITGIFIERAVLNGNHIPVALAGHFHGILFLVYIVAVLVLAPSLHWGFWRMLLAGLCSVPPFGSLAFEQWEHFRREHSGIKQLSATTRYHVIAQSTLRV